jgi:hypothetical protein
MPIVARTSAECFDIFRGHVAKLLADTVTQKHPLTQTKPERGRTIIGFRQGELVGVPLKTRFGRVYFYLSQSLRTVKQDGGSFRLETRQYWYRVQTSKSRGAQAILRWEYDAETQRDGHARHHMQMPAAIAIGEGSIDLNKAHLPTGWVTIEEVIRFLIVDLGVEPPCGEGWPGVLHASERRFFEEFTGKRRPAQ